MNDLKYIEFDFLPSSAIGIEEVTSVFNMPFLGMFGGNVEMSQPAFRKEGEILKSWWGNSYGIDENSDTERFLKSMVLSTSTPEKLKKVILKDLSFLNPFMDILVDVYIPTVNRINIDILLTEKNTGKTTEITYIWNSLMNDLNGSIEGNNSLQSGLDYTLDFSL